MSEKALHFYLRDHGAVLANRRRGRVAAERLRDLAVESGDIVIDFTSVEAVTPPFVQELLDAVHAILARDPDSGRLVVVAHPNEDVLETFKLVLDSRKGAMAFRVGEQVEVLSSSAPHLLELLREAQKLRRFTAPELAERLHLQVNALHGRLKPLLESGVVGREPDPDAKRGRRHVYRVVNMDEPVLEGAADPGGRVPA